MVARRRARLLSVILGLTLFGLPAPSFAAPTRYLYTVAGMGRSGFSGDGGPATDARVNARCIAALRDGDLLIAGGARVRRIDRRGRIDTVAGTGVHGFSGDGGPALAARLARSAACGLAGESDGGYLLA